MEPLIAHPSSLMDDAKASRGATLLFRDISYAVPVGNELRVILEGVTGFIEPGQCCAILGSSGSGKTSLLDILAGQNQDKRVRGQVWLNDVVATPQVIQEYTGYVMQDDRLLPYLTVRETLLYSARLRLSSRLTSKAKEDEVDRVIATLGLRNVANDKIGGVFRRGLSGGEKRRVTIALQLLGEPSVLFLDEPTTGLDSFTANSIVGSLRALASTGQTVVFTIHQPRSDIFALLDRMMLLSQGQVAYFGPATALIDHFTSLSYPCAHYVNPLDFYIDVVSIDKRSHRVMAETTARMKTIVHGYRTSSLYSDLIRRVDAYERAPSRLALAETPRPMWVAVFATLVARQLTNLSRDVGALFNRMFQFFFFGVLLVAFIIKFGHDQESVQNRTGFLFEVLSVALFLGIMNAMSLFPEHRDLFYRERRNGRYGAFTFILSYIMHTLPTALWASGTFTLVTYIQLEMKHGTWEPFIFWAIMLVLHIFGELMGIFLLGLMYDVDLAHSIGALVLSIALLFSSGFLRSTEEMPEVFNILSYSVIGKYASELLVVNEFSNQTFTCDFGGTGTPCRYPTGNYYIETLYNGADERGTLNWALLVGFLGIFYLLSAVVFHVKKQMLR